MRDLRLNLRSLVSPKEPTLTTKPLLRPLDFQPVNHQGQQMWYLHDPQQLTDQQLVMPPVLAQMLLFCDGAHTPDAIHAALCQRVGFNVPRDVVDDALARLDEACLLDNERSRQALQGVVEAYRNQPFRPPSLAGLSYPERPFALAAMLEGYSGADDLNGWQPWRGRALISPHIDYQRGGPVYAKVWQRAQTAVLEADLVIMFGTDHRGGAGTFTLTRLPYATPYGVLPTDTAVIDHVAAAIGEDVAYAEELHHRQEHAIELSAVWLHHIYHQAGVAPKPMIPILTGSFHHFVQNGGHPAEDETLKTAVAALQKATGGKRVLTVASVDFAHVGPAFGDDFPITAERRAALRRSDNHLVHAITQGDAASFYDQIAAVQDQNRICGFSPIYLMLQYLGGQNSVEGIRVAYDQCPADDEDTSFVSINGILLE